jgi:hypothetical protein
LNVGSAFSGIVAVQSGPAGTTEITEATEKIGRFRPDAIGVLGG